MTTTRRLTYLGIGLLCLITVLRLIFISTTLVVDDESYYYVWTHHLAGGYIDGGPTIAFVNALFVFLFGANGFGVRIGAVFLMTVLAVYLWWWGTKRFGALTGFLLLVFVTVTPLCFTASVVHTYDTEMAFWMLAAIAFYYDAYFVDARSFLLAGFALGLALLSKVSVLFPALGIFLTPFLVPELRKTLRTPGFWLSFLVAAAVFSPFIWWNLTHDMAFIHYKGGMAFRTGSLEDFIEVWGAQVILFFPIVFWFALVLPVRTVLASLRDRRAVPSDIYFALVGIIPIAYFVIGSLFSRYYANWVAPTFFGGLLLTVIYFGRQWERYRVPAVVHMALSSVILLLMLLQVWFHVLPLPPNSDPTTRYFAFAGVVPGLRAFLAAHPEDQSLRIVGNDYQIPSFVNMYLQPPMEATGLSLGGYHDTLYTMLYPPDKLAGQTFLFICRGDKFKVQKIASLEKHFTSVTKLADFFSMRGSVLVGHYTLWLVTGFDGKRI